MDTKFPDSNALRRAGALGVEGSPVLVHGMPLQKIELRKLRHAAVLAFEGNFARAAEKLHITPSALSQSIAKLEDDLGLVLFDRDKSGASLSRVGRQFIGRIDKLLFEARGLAHDLALASAANAGEVVFGIRPDPARILLGDLLRQLAQEAPKLQVKIAITINEVLLEYLLHEGLEFVICDADVPELDDRLSSTSIGGFALDFYVRAGHPLAERRSFSLEQLRAYPTASPHLTGDNYAAVCAWLGLAPSDPFPPTVWCDDYAYLMEVVLHADAVLLAPSMAVSKETASGQLVRIQPRDARRPARCELFLIALANRSLSPPAALIVERIKALVAERRDD
jgi:DNA-binding transcriptional LysR family regulator